MRLKRSTLKLIVIALAVMGVGMLNNLGATPTSSVNLKVTCAPALSVNVGTATYSFGTVGTNQTALSTGAIPVNNDSAGRTEDYQITGANSTNWTISNSTNGADTFYLRALLNSVAPTQANFTAVFSTLSTVIANMSAANYGGDQNGKSVVSGGAKNLWFMLGSPTSTSSSAEQTISVTLTAADAGTF